MSLAMIGSAVKLATAFAPDIIGLFDEDKGSKAQEAAKVVTGLAESITGQKGDAAMKALEADPKLALEFKKAVMADKYVSEEMRYKDVADARDMYKTQNKLADYVGQKIIDHNLWFVGVLAAFNVAVILGTPVVFPESTAVVAGVAGSIGTLIGGIIQQLLKERQDVVNFLFGSSMGSKIKDMSKRFKS